MNKIEKNHDSNVDQIKNNLQVIEINKFAKIDEAKLKNVDKEMYLLETLKDELNIEVDLSDLEAKLEAVNLELWHIENYKRACEKDQNFDEGFVNAARQVYLKNDLRASIKKQINELVGSTIVEEKSY